MDTDGSKFEKNVLHRINYNEEANRRRLDNVYILMGMMGFMWP